MGKRLKEPPKGCVRYMSIATITVMVIYGIYVTAISIKALSKFTNIFDQYTLAASNYQ
jgi:hypothetical protein